MQELKLIACLMLVSVLTGLALQEFCSHWGQVQWTAQEQFYLDQFQQLVADKPCRAVSPGFVAFDLAEDRR